MWEDPIVAEVHRAREKLAAESNFDVKTFFDGLRERQGESGAKLVRPRQKPDQSLKSIVPAVAVSDNSQSAQARPAAER